MAVTSAAKGEDKQEQPLPTEQCPEVKDEEDSKGQMTTDQQDTSLSLTTRLMLSSEMLGNEAVISFKDIYAVPDLQTQGMSLSLVSLTGMISGPAAMLLLPIMGWFSDRGTNFRLRRMWMLLLATLILVSGALTVIATNLLPLLFCSPENRISSHQNLTLETANASVDTHSSRRCLENSCDASDCDCPLSVSTLPTDIDTSSEDFELKMPSTTESLQVSTDCLSADSGITMLGYSLVELGYDLVTSFLRTWMLTCSPPIAPTPTLVAGLVMTSAGGILTSVLGMVDLSSLFELSSGMPSGLRIQISIQAAVAVITTIAGMSLSLLVGSRQLKRLHSKDHHQEYLEDNISHTEHEISIDIPLKDDTQDETHLYPKPANNSMNYGTIEKSSSEVESAIPLGSSLGIDDHSPQDAEQPFLCQGLCFRRKWAFSTNIAILFCVFYFASGALILPALTLSDFVGKAIFNGDADAPAGSDALARYQKGIQFSSYGFLINYAAYMTFSFVQQPVLACMGHTLEFMALSVLLCVSLIVLALTTRMETFFLLSVLTGIYKAMFHVVPFSVINTLVHAEAQRRGDGKGLQLGMAISLMIFTLPLTYCTLYPWVGSMTELTGVLATPLLLAAAYVCFAAALFLLLGYRDK